MKRTLWVVDDLPTNITLIAETFKSDDRIVLKTSLSGREFLASAEQEGFPDLLILDLMMPDMDGIAILEALRPIRDRRYFPVILISAISDKQSIIQALSHGADDYITKPFFIDELRVRVSNMFKIKERDECLNISLDVMETNLLEKLRMLEGTQLETILKLGRAAEFRDDETGRHIERISEYVYIVADYLKISREQTMILKHAAPMHDVGKIGIPDGILLKPGKLSADEFSIIKLHTVIGAKILSGTTLPMLEIAKEIALSHHEKWDGSGYPLRLKENDIPLSGRIVAVVDVFDAITSDRVYKSAWPIEDALEFIRQQRGLHFDPQIVDAFLSCTTDILAVKTKHKDITMKPLIQQIIDGDIRIDEYVERWR
jgi:putative two-component system response regulator